MDSPFRGNILIVLHEPPGDPEDGNYEGDTKIVSTLTATERRYFDLSQKTGFRALVSYILDFGQARSTSAAPRLPFESDNSLVE